MSAPACDPDNRDFNEVDPGWYWRNCRALSFSVHLHFWPWHFRAERDDGVYDGYRALSIGPLTIGARYGIGNSSKRWFALCENEAFERALRFSGRASS